MYGMCADSDFSNVKSFHREIDLLSIGSVWSCVYVSRYHRDVCVHVYVCQGITKKCVVMCMGQGITEKCVVMYMCVNGISQGSVWSCVSLSKYVKVSQGSVCSCVCVSMYHMEVCGHMYVCQCLIRKSVVMCMCVIGIIGRCVIMCMCVNVSQGSWWSCVCVSRYHRDVGCHVYVC